MSVSRPSTNVDLVSMIGTIALKGAECTSGNVKRLCSGSNRLRAVVIRKYCCRAEGESLISASIDQFQFLSFNEKSEETTINFVHRTKRNYSVTILHL